MTVVAVIPARGGSTGIPGKNLRKFDGESLLARCIQMAWKAETIDRLIVSSNCPDILDAADKLRVQTVQRPEPLANNDCPVDLSILHVIDHLNIDATVAIRLNCTAPFTTAQDIDNCVKAIWDNNLKRSACSVAGHPYGHYLMDHNGHLLNRHWGTIRQDFTDQWEIDGGVCAGPMATLRRVRNVLEFSPVVSPVPVPAQFPYCCEIDTEEDWRYALALLPLTKVAMPTKN